MIQIETSRYPVVALTHPGMSGKNNEDRFAVSAYQVNQPQPLQSLVAVLSDGIGGHKAGEVAAEIAVNEVSRLIGASNIYDPLEIIEAGILRASLMISEQAQQNSHTQYGMGATIACVWIINDQLYTATVGDSRIYLLRSNQIQQLNTDHTWIQDALDNGILTPEEAFNHPNAHVIRRYLGSPEPPRVDFRLRLAPDEDDETSVRNQGLKLLPGDRLLLCSDGLTDLVSDPEILAALNLKNAMQPAVEELIDTANQRGGHDNITIIAIEIPKNEVPEKTPPKKRTLLTGGYLILTVLSGILIGLVISFLWLNGWIFQPSVTQTPTPVTSTAAELFPSPPTRVPTAGTPTPLRSVAAPTQTGSAAPLSAATITPWPTDTTAP